MSTVEHQATVDKGLKMKIKRKNVCVSKKEPKLEIVKTDSNPKSQCVNITPGQSGNSGVGDKSKLPLFGDKSPSKSKATPNKKDKSKTGGKSGETSNTGSYSSSVNGLDSLFGQSTMEPKLGETANVKKECVPDPYEFNAKVEDGIPALPMKKIKLEKEKVYSIYRATDKWVSRIEEVSSSMLKMQIQIQSTYVQSLLWAFAFCYTFYSIQWFY